MNEAIKPIQRIKIIFPISMNYQRRMVSTSRPITAIEMEVNCKANVSLNNNNQKCEVYVNGEGQGNGAVKSNNKARSPSPDDPCGKLCYDLRKFLKG